MHRTDMKLDNEQGSTRNTKGNIIGDIIISIIIVSIIFILFIISNSIINDIRLNQEKENVGKRAEKIATEKIKEKHPEKSFEIISTNVYVYPGYIGISRYVDRTNVILHIKENNEEYNVAVDVDSETISDNIQEKENVKNLAKKLATAKLKEKYPERNFEITDILVNVWSNSLDLKEDRVIVNVKDNNEKYTVIVNCRLREISDNIQANEITEAIKERLIEIIKIDSDTIEFNVWKYENYDKNDKILCFHNKYNGNIIDFLYNENHENNEYSYLYKMAICILYRNGEEHFYINKNNDEFLQLFNNVLLIDYKDIKPSYPLEFLFNYSIYDKYSYMQNKKRELQQSVNEFYVYDENIHNFKKILE